MTPIDNESQQDDAHQHLERWYAFLKRAMRFWMTPLVVLFIGGIACAAFLYVRKPKFQSETVILYVERGSPIKDESGAPRNVTVRLKELLLSRPKLEQIVTQFNLYPEVQRKFGTLEAVEELKKHIEFKAPGGDTFSIAFKGSTAVEAQAVTEALSRLVLEGDSSLRSEQAQAAAKFLGDEKKITETQLRDAEQKLAAFMAQHPRFALDATPLTNGAAIRATFGAGGTSGHVTSQLSRRSMTISRSKTNGSTTGSSQSDSAATPAAPVDLDVGRARAALAAAQENLAEKMTHYTSAHPDVRAAEGAVERAAQRLQAAESAAPRVVIPPPTPVVTEQSAPRTMAANPAAPNPTPSNKPTQDVVEIETQWLKLTRAVTEARQRHDQVETQLFKAGILANSEGGGHGVQVNVIDPAFLPERPLPPGRTTIALVFIALSLVIGMGIALLRAAFDDRVWNGPDAAGIAEILVEVPRISTKRRSYVAS